MEILTLGGLKGQMAMLCIPMDLHALQVWRRSHADGALVLCVTDFATKPIL